MSWAVAALLGVCCAGLVVALVGARRRAVRAEAALGAAHRDLVHLERSFQRFAPSDVVERIAGGAQDLGATTRDVTILFADIRGFTALSEQIEPAVMIQILNGYFTAMNQAIVAHHGRMSRIMGDGLMALFGALDDNPWHPADSVRAALEMRDALERYDDHLAEQGLPRLRFGVGIHRGTVVAAVMGSDELREYTVIGDPVNLAARVEALTKKHGVDVLITSAVREALDDRFELREMPLADVPGKTIPVATWAVVSYRP